jgi:hypothetical protein
MCGGIWAALVTLEEEGYGTAGVYTNYLAANRDDVGGVRMLAMWIGRFCCICRRILF